MAEQQAGWYADPLGDKSKLRYWDGDQWTDDYMEAMPASQPIQPEPQYQQTQPIQPESQYQQAQPIPVQSAQETPGYPYGQQPAPNYAPNMQQPPAGNRGKGLGIASLVMGIVGVVCAFVPGVNVLTLPMVLIGVILGIVSLVLASNKRGPKVFGIIGIVASVIAIIITVAMYLILAATYSSADIIEAYTGIDTNGNVDIEELSETLDEVIDQSAQTHENIRVDSIVFNEAMSGEFTGYYTVTLENTGTESIGYISVSFPLYDTEGTEISFAYGAATEVPPGIFTIDAMCFKEEGQELIFKIEEVSIISW